MWRNILKNTLLGIILLNITSIGIKKFNPDDTGAQTSARNNVEFNQSITSEIGCVMLCVGHDLS